MYSTFLFCESPEPSDGQMSSLLFNVHQKVYDFLRLLHGVEQVQDMHHFLW